MEYVSLSRDTTETDLKQRREIVSGTVKHVDQVGDGVYCILGDATWGKYVMSIIIFSNDFSVSHSQGYVNKRLNSKYLNKIG